MEDRDIIEMYFARNEDAIEATSEKYGRLIYNISKRIVEDSHDADECVNDTYLGAWRAIPPERPASLSAFLVKIARNISIGRLRYRLADKRSSDVLLSLDELEDIIPDGSDIEKLEDKEIGRMISDYLYTEKEEIRNIFIRKYWYFDSISDISQKLGMSESKIKSILHRTRQKLRLYLSQKGVAI